LRAAHHLDDARERGIAPMLGPKKPPDLLNGADDFIADFFSTGIGSPVSMDSSTEEWPR
jgi:hypothetical protein